MASVTPPPEGTSVNPTQSGPKKKPIYKKWWFWAIVVVVLIVLGSSLGGGGESSDSPTTAPTTTNDSSEQGAGNEAQSQTAEEKAPAPEITVTADELAKAYSENELGADQTYKGKKAQISGKMDSVSEVLGHKSLRLTGNDEFQFNGVTCPISNDQVDKAAALQKGAEVTVVATIDGFNQLDVELKDCVIN